MISCSRIRCGCGAVSAARAVDGGTSNSAAGGDALGGSSQRSDVNPLGGEIHLDVVRAIPIPVCPIVQLSTTGQTLPIGQTFRLISRSSLVPVWPNGSRGFLDSGREIRLIMTPWPYSAPAGGKWRALLVPCSSEHGHRLRHARRVVVTRGSGPSEPGAHVTPGALDLDVPCCAANPISQSLLTRPSVFVDWPRKRGAKPGKPGKGWIADEIGD